MSFWIGLVLPQAAGASQARIKLDQLEIDAAIDKGCTWILGREAGFMAGTWDYGDGYLRKEGRQSRRELAVLALAHGGTFDLNKPPASDHVAAMTRKNLRPIDAAALQAITLQKIGPNKYFWRITESAHDLVANQRSRRIVVFRVDKSGALKPTGHSAEVLHQACGKTPSP